MLIGSINIGYFIWYFLPCYIVKMYNLSLSPFKVHVTFAVTVT